MKSRKLNHQPTGFVETKLAGGITGDEGGKRGERVMMSKVVGRGVSSFVSPMGKNRKIRMWQLWYLAPYSLVITWLQWTHTACCHSCEHTQFKYMQHVNTCIYINPDTLSHTIIQRPVVQRSSANSLWHAGLEWFAVIKQPPVKFKQVFCNSLIHGQGEGLKWDCRVWSIKLIRRFEEGSLSHILLFLQSDPGWKWELIRKRRCCCPAPLC